MECGECGKNVKNTGVFRYCTFCQNCFHEKCRQFTKPGVPVKCFVCVRKFVEIQVAIARFDHRSDMDSPEFEKALNSLPKIDYLYTVNDEFPEIPARYATVFMYWVWDMCNSWGCKDPWGKKSFFSFDCCINKKFCCTLCHENSHIVKTKIEGEEDKTEEIKCDGPECDAIEGKVVRCNKCQLVKYCSMKCKKDCEMAHMDRCCNVDATVKENGKMSIMIHPK